jgi:hypothetical protein
VGGRVNGRGGAVALLIALAPCTFSSAVRASDLDPELEAQLATADQGDLDPVKVGFRGAFFLLGSFVGGGGAFAWEPESWLEYDLGFAFARATIDESRSDGGTATGDIRGGQFFLDLRFWIGEQHAVVPDVALIVSSFAADVKALDLSGNTFHYTRSGIPTMLRTGVSYGYRTGFFRINVGAGTVISFTQLYDSEVVATSTFPDTVGLQRKLDERTDALLDAELFGELSIGLLFY